MNHHHHHIYNEAAEPLSDDDILRGMCMVYVMLYIREWIDALGTRRKCRVECVEYKFWVYARIVKRLVLFQRRYVFIL